MNRTRAREFLSFPSFSSADLQACALLDTPSREIRDLFVTLRRRPRNPRDCSCPIQVADDASSSARLRAANWLVAPVRRVIAAASAGCIDPPPFRVNSQGFLKGERLRFARFFLSSFFFFFSFPFYRLIPSRCVRKPRRSWYSATGMEDDFLLRT
jgi:hypothetical protein